MTISTYNNSSNFNQTHFYTPASFNFTNNTSSIFSVSQNDFNLDSFCHLDIKKINLTTLSSEIDLKYAKEGFPLALNQQPSKVDPKYAKEKFLPAPKKTASKHPPKVNSKYAKEEFLFNKNVNKDSKKHNCLPKSGRYHRNDVEFYDRVASAVKTNSIRSIKESKEGRCAGTLYLRAEDTNYMHAIDGYLRSEDTRAIGEIPDKVAEKLINEGRVWYRIVEKVKDICKHIDAIRKSGGKIKRLIIVGHGNKEEILLSQKGGNTQDIYNRFFNFNSDQFPFSRGNTNPLQSQHKLQFDFGNLFDDAFKIKPSTKDSGMDKYILDMATQFPQKGCLRNLEPEAEIILLSCSTGKKIGQSRNIADAIASQAPGHRVVAPLSDFTLSQVKEKKINGKLKIYFKDSKGKDITYIALAKKSK